MRIGQDDHIVVTGGTGFLGSHLLPVLRARHPAARVTALNSRDYDLLDPAQAARMFADRKPTVVVHLAAYSGGIEANRSRQADFFHRNLILMENVFHGAARHGVRRLVYPMGGCAYPNTAGSPIDEAQMWAGLPVETSLGYSMAKKMGIVASFAYRQQHGLDSIVIVPGNLYGEHDNYRIGESHVIPGLIRRFYEARVNGLPSVTIWGTGRPTRDFVYAGDVAAAIPWFLENDEEKGPVNISSGTTTTIRDLAATVAELSGYRGELHWDRTKPDGQVVKIFDVTRMRALGLHCDTPLRAGLERTIAWFARHYGDPGVVRL
jgi:GDP-L-fucose synthase